MSYEADSMIGDHDEQMGCPVVSFEAFGPEVAADPHPFYGALQSQCPVAGFPFDGAARSFVVSRHEDVTYVLRNPQIFSSANAVDIGNERPLIPLQIDPPEHVKWRRFMDPTLAPKQVALLEGDFRKLVNEVIDGFIDQDQIDFHEQFSMPLPTTMFLRLLGCPADLMPTFVRWKDNIIRPWAATQEEAAEIRSETAQEMYAYFGPEIEERRKNPRDDLLTVCTHGIVDDRPLTQNEILDILFLLFIAGLDTVTATLDCTMSYLATNPDRQRHLVEHPEVMPGAVEEFLRFHTPVMGVIREVEEATELHGVEMNPGDHVMVMVGAANIDESQFETPHDMDFEREVNKHYAFGAGPHRCLGSHFARLELRCALEEFHKRIPSYELVDGVELHFSPGIREVAQFPLVIHPAGG
jgi:cytochrome P450